MFATYALILLCIGACKANKRILLEDNYYAIIQRLTALETEVGDLKRENAALKAVKPVAFKASLTKDVTGSNRFIIFDHVKLNIGNAYNPAHGNFIAPYNGTYLFTVYACSLSGHYIDLDLHVNSVVYDQVLAGDTVYNECTSMSTLVSLKQNDDVFVKHESSGDYLHAFNRPSFGGVLLSVE